MSEMYKEEKVDMTISNPQTPSSSSAQAPPKEAMLAFDEKDHNADLLEKLSWLEKENQQLNIHVNTLELDNKILTDIIAVLKKSYHTALQKTQTPSYFDE